MKKYLELFTDGFDATIAEKTKVENRPYVGYSPREGVVFTVIPEPVVGPANSEIWYTSTDGAVVTPYKTDYFGANIVSNTYENGKGVITFGGPVTSIGDYAFYSCDSSTSITIPNSVTSIGECAFDSCSSLTSITIPDSVTSIGYRAFRNCTSLTSVTIGNCATNAMNEIFYGCTSLTSVVWNVKNCSDFGSISYVPFYDIRHQITSFVFGDNVEHVPAYLCEGMSKLTSITIPNSVTSIGKRAFYGCKELTSIIIPNSVKSIGDYVFKSCTSLRYITFQGSKQEWRAISKGSDWSFYVTYVKCTDGDVRV